MKREVKREMKREMKRGTKREGEEADTSHAQRLLRTLQLENKS